MSILIVDDVCSGSLRSANVALVNVHNRTCERAKDVWQKTKRRENTEAGQRLVQALGRYRTYQTFL